MGGQPPPAVPVPGPAILRDPSKGEGEAEQDDPEPHEEEGDPARLVPAAVELAAHRSSPANIDNRPKQNEMKAAASSARSMARDRGPWVSS